MNKLGANMQTIKSAEKLYTRIQLNGKSNSEVDTEALGVKSSKAKAHIDLAAG
jgi:hypothetical protein